MAQPQVWVYLDERTKQIVATTAQGLGIREAELFRVLAVPKIKQVYKLLKSGKSPAAIRKAVGIGRE